MHVIREGAAQQESEQDHPENHSPMKKRCTLCKGKYHFKKGTWFAGHIATNMFATLQVYTIFEQKANFRKKQKTRRGLKENGRHLVKQLPPFSALISVP